MAEWLVTSSNPARDVSGMDFERCAALHNYLVNIGRAGTEVQIPDAQFPTWWNHYVESGDPVPSDEILSTLSPSLVEFLKLARVKVGPEDESAECNFFYYLYGLNNLEGITASRSADSVSPAVVGGKYFYLYAATNITSHPGGLMYDATTDKAIIQMSIFSYDDSIDGAQTWFPLEVILSKYIEMVMCGKAVADDTKPCEPCQELISPWLIEFYSKPIMQTILNAFDALVASIESRMPQLRDSVDESSAIIYGLASQDQLDEAGIRSEFAREFIRRARRPRFDFIAPGLAVLCGEDIINQPIQPTEPQPWGPVDYEMSILLFGNNKTAVDEWVHADSRLDVPSGLYLCDSYDWPHCGVLMLPYKIGQNRYARKDNASRGQEHSHAHSSVNEPFGTLYEGRYNSFIDLYSGTRLEIIFDNWRELVELGIWTIDVSGVAGGIDIFKEADTEERWELYDLPTSW